MLSMCHQRQAYYDEHGRMPGEHSKESRSTYLVVVLEARAFKVGRALNPWSRVRELQTASPFDLKLVHVIPVDIESKIHEALAPCLIRNEWFRYSAKAVTILRGISGDGANALLAAFVDWDEF